MKGVVKFFNHSKGFGFITPDDGGKEVFLPLTTVTTSGSNELTAGQYVLFEIEMESKGPKAVKLTLLDDEPKLIPHMPITIYHDASSDDSAEVLAVLNAAGLASKKELDYVANPPTHEELKDLSLMLQETDQSLARRYDHLFMELQLDDRFISDTDFWTAISEHPSLINGPILVREGRARICKTADDVRSFLKNGETRSRRTKGVSPKFIAMMNRQSLPPKPQKEKDGSAEQAKDTATRESAAEQPVSRHQKLSQEPEIRLALRGRRVFAE